MPCNACLYFPHSITFNIKFSNSQDDKLLLKTYKNFNYGLSLSTTSKADLAKKKKKFHQY